MTHHYCWIPAAGRSWSDAVAVPAVDVTQAALLHAKTYAEDTRGDNFDGRTFVHVAVALERDAAEHTLCTVSVRHVPEYHVRAPGQS